MSPGPNVHHLVREEQDVAEANNGTLLNHKQGGVLLLHAPHGGTLKTLRCMKSAGHQRTNAAYSAHPGRAG